MSKQSPEQWAKYLKEMETIGPLLSENLEDKGSGVIGQNGKLQPINEKFELFDKTGARIIKKEDQSRAIRRKQDRNKKKFDKRLSKVKGDDREYLNRMLKMDQSKTWLKDIHRVTQMKQDKINIWFEEEMHMLVGSEKMVKIKKCMDKKGRLPWRYWYIKCKIQHGVEPYPWGTDTLAITVFGRIHASTTYIWDNK